jgi:thioredoxin-related protein
MKKLYSAVLLVSFLVLSSLSNSYAQAPVAEYKASMPDWEVKLEKAYEASSKTGKPILANFTGSDWCGWCIRLKNEVFTKPKFKEWADANVVLLELDFPRRMKLPDDIAKQNQELKQAFGIQGFPTLWLFNVSADPTTGKSAIKGIAKTGYVAGGPNAWIKDLEGKIKVGSAK